MDSKDLSSSPSMVAHMGSLSVEDDNLLSLTAGLARDADIAFHSGRFSECVDLMNQLLQKKEDDPQVIHNSAIARYFNDGCLDPKKLLEVLNQIKSDKLACALGEHVDSDSNINTNAVSESKGNTDLVPQLTSASSSHIVKRNAFDTSAVMLNTAVIWFHLHEYSKAYAVLDSVYGKIEPVDEGMALQICLLFLDVALASHDPWKFIDVMNYVEKAYCASNLTGQSDSGSCAQQQSPNLVGKSSLPSNSIATDASATDSVASANASGSPLSRTLSEENLETLISTIDMSGQSLTRPSGPHSSNDLSRTSADRSISVSDLRVKLHLYKVRLLLLTRNLKACKREIKNVMTMNLARGNDSSLALLLKSQLEYARGNYPKAIKLLIASNNQTDLEMSSIYNNNLGCIYYRLGKYHTSGVFLSKALSNCSSLRKEKPLKLSTFSKDKSLHIIYNCGVQYLACGNPVLAARCFHKASLVFYKRPLLWLRIAECCLMALDKGLLNSNPEQGEKQEIKVHVIGKGKWRQLALEDGAKGNGLVEKDGFSPSGGKQLTLSLSLARQCLLNALYLLNSSESTLSTPDVSHGSSMDENESREVGQSEKAKVHSNGEAKEQRGGNGPNATLQNSIMDYEDICRRERRVTKQAVLADLAFVELVLGNPLKSLSTAKSLLELPECSRVYIFYGHLYAAESLCLLNRPKEAGEHLKTYLSAGSNAEIPYTEDDFEQLRVHKFVESEETNTGLRSSHTSLLGESQLKPEDARGTLYANLAVLSAIEGDFEQAQQFIVQALSRIPNSTEATLTAIYVDLMLGKTQEALSQLKQFSGAIFVPGSIQSS